MGTQHKLVQGNPILCCEIAWCAHLNKTLLKLPSSLNEAKLRLLLSSSFLLLQQQQQQQIVVRCVQTPNRAAYITADHFGRPKFATMLLLSCSKSGRREEEEERKLFMLLGTNNSGKSAWQETVLKITYTT
jgi:hypothetical protein